MNDNHQERFDQLASEQQGALESDKRQIREAAINNVHSRIDDSPNDPLVKDVLKKKVSEFYQES